MRAKFALAMLALAACTPAPKEPDLTVTAIYDTLVKSKGETPTPQSAIPMTDDLKALVAKAEASTAPGEPVFDFDLAGNCQDCTGFNSLKTGKAPAEQEAKVKAGHKMVEASFKTGSDVTAQTTAVYWDMVETPQGWRVDDIFTDDFELRAVAETIIQSAAQQAAAAAKDAEGTAAVECATYILLQQGAAPKDAKKLDAPLAAWRAKAATYFNPDELAQFLASSQAVLDDTPPKDLAELASVCVTKAPAQPLAQ